MPFVSLDIKKLDSVYTYLALIDRSGLLSIYEPTSFDNFREWSLLDQWNVCSPNPPDRGAETSFKVRFDQNTVSTPYMNSLTDDTKLLSLVATAMDTAKIYRSAITQNNPSSNPSALPLAGQKQTTFYEAARFPTHPALIRDVQWAPFNIRGFDLFATACRDGGVRIYRLDTTATTTATKPGTTTTPSHPPPSTTTPHPSSPLTPPHQPPHPQQRPTPQSSLTSAIAGRSTTTTPTPNTSSITTPSRQQQVRPTPPSPFTHTITLETELANAHRDAWALCWDPAGQVLMSSGSDGVTKLWKRAVAAGSGGGEGGQGEWMLFADQEVDVEEGGSDGEGQGGNGNGDGNGNGGAGGGGDGE